MPTTPLPQPRGALLAALFVLLAPCTFAAQERPKLTLGAVLPMSGPQAPFGQEAERGMSLALEHLQKKDPEIAATMTLAIADDKSSPRDVGAAVEQLTAKDKAHLFIGSLTGPQSQALVDTLAVQGRPIVIPASATIAAPAGAPVFRVALDDGEQAAALAEYLVTQRQAKKVWILRDDGDAARRTAERFTASLAMRGGALQGSELFELGAEDFAGQVTKLKAAGADFVFLPASFHTAAAVAKELKRQGATLVLAGTDAWDTPQLAREAGDAANGAVHTAAFAADDKDAATQAFVLAFKTKFGRQPGSIAALAYDAVLLVADTVKRAGANQAAALAQEFGRTMSLAGATGLMTHATDGSPQKSAILKEVSAGVAAGSVFRARILASAAPVTAAAPGPVAAAPPPVASTAPPPVAVKAP